MQPTEPQPRQRVEKGGSCDGVLLKGRVITGWRNAAATGQPVRLVPDSWREPALHERKRRAPAPPTPTPNVKPARKRAPVEQGKLL